jgi:hypothetical protein
LIKLQLQPSPQTKDEVNPFTPSTCLTKVPSVDVSSLMRAQPGETIAFGKETKHGLKEKNK